MNNIDYKFVFDDMVDGFNKAKVYKLSQSHFNDFDFALDNEQIPFLAGQSLSSVQADLLDIATAIHFADKLAVPNQNKSIKVHISMRLRNPDLFKRHHQLIQNIMYWYTKDLWTFEFYPRFATKRKAEISVKHFKLKNKSENIEIALWSGGLDSLAGLDNRLREGNKTFTLIGTGGNKIMQKTQHQVFKALRFWANVAGRLRFLHIPIYASYGKRFTHNQSHRARGVVFILIGAVCALSSGIKKLHIYETGIGAINLPLPGGVGRDHSKAVHPLSLIKLENFISELIGEQFLIENPFIFKTKGQMCSSLKQYPETIYETISCDGLRREKHIQCGYCSSCLLRRQALIAADIKDKTKYLFPHGKIIQQEHLSSWRLMDQQVQILSNALDSKEPFFQLSMSYPNDLPEIISAVSARSNRNFDDVKNDLVNLYRTYVREWPDFNFFIKNGMNYTNYQNYLEDEKWQQMQLIN